MRRTSLAPEEWGDDDKSDKWEGESQADSWEARGQCLWKSSDDEEDWNSDDDRDYHGDGDEGDEGDASDLEIMLPQRRETPCAVSLEVRTSSASVLPSDASICSSPSSSRVPSRMYITSTLPSTPSKAVQSSWLDSPSKGSSQSRQSITDSEDSTRFFTPPVWSGSATTSPSKGSDNRLFASSTWPSSTVPSPSRDRLPFSASAKLPPPSVPSPVWTDSEEDDDSSDYTSSSSEDQSPAFNVNELVAHLRELGYHVPVSDKPVDLKELLAKMDEYFQDLFKKQADQRKVVETEAETETIIQEVHQWGKHKTLWMMLNDLSPPNDKCHLKPDAAFDVVAKQYKKVLLRIHPDKNVHKGWREHVRATEQFKLVSAAFFSHKKKLHR